MKKILLALSAFLTIQAASAQQSYTIRGQIKNVPSADWVYVTTDWALKEYKDSVPVKNNRFKYSGKAGAEPVLTYLYLRYKDEKKGYKRHLVTDLFIEKGNIDVQITGIGFRDSSKVTGTPTNNDYLEYLHLKSAFQEDMSNYIKSSEYVQLPGQAKREQYNEKLNSMCTKFVKSHPSSFFSLVLLEGELLRVNKPDTLLSLFNELHPSVKNGAGGKAYAKMITSAGQIKVDIQAPGFTEKDTSGAPVSLSSFKGQYVLVDFWASWCHPCRAENPHLLAAYSKFKDRNFIILSVSMDNSKAAWLKAIHDDKLPWQQISALNPQQSESAQKYGVKAIPRNFLIDPSGKIVAMDLRGEAINSKLEEVLN